MRPCPLHLHECAQDGAHTSFGRLKDQRASAKREGTLWVQPCGKFWIVERSPLSDPTDWDETLIFAFVLMPIWTRTMTAAMRLAEYCDPIVQSPIAGYWARTFD
jgi:hypothetical protein